MCRGISDTLLPAAEQFLRVAKEKGRDRETRGVACLGLAQSLMERRDIAMKPWIDDKPTAFRKFLEERYDESWVRYARGGEPKSLLDEASALFEQAIRDYGDLVAYRYKGRVTTIADVAKGDLRKLRLLNIGQEAPEIEGKDAEGKPFRLSDFRGKVVVLTFSGNWCAPCRELYARERELVERHRHEPFVLLSVNTDEEVATLKASLSSREITWRCWWDGGIGGPICTQWDVKSFPTIFVLDGRGVIRHREIRGEELSGVVESLLKGATP